MGKARQKRTRFEIHQFSDEELESELIRRRRESAMGKKLLASPSARLANDAIGEQLRQAYSTLRLPRGAPLAEVRKSYRALMRSFHPDRHAKDKSQEKAATEVSQSITKAYKALIAYLDKQ